MKKALTKKIIVKAPNRILIDIFVSKVKFYSSISIFLYLSTIPITDYKQIILPLIKPLSRLIS